MAHSEDRARVRIPPPLLFLSCLALFGALDHFLPLEVISARTRPIFILVALLFLLSGYLALHAVLVLKKHGTHIDTSRPTSRIVTSGPFRFSRNPMYLSLVLLGLGLAVLLTSVWLLLGSAVVLILLDRLAIRPEEAYLAEKFGQAYAAYSAKVRRWI